MSENIRATTADGRKVLLRDDGTWSYEPLDRLSNPQGGFRKIPWGTSRQEVEAQQREEVLDRDDEHSVYPGQLAGLPCSICYCFTEGLLTSVMCLLEEPHSSDNAYVTEFLRLKDLFTKKYGEPTEDLVSWADPLYKDDPDKWGFAVGRGDLSFATRWSTDDSMVSLVLRGDNYKFYCVADYVSKDMSSLAKGAQERKLLEDL